jgi:hypothetical protein
MSGTSWPRCSDSESGPNALQSLPARAAFTVPPPPAPNPLPFWGGAGRGEARRGGAGRGGAGPRGGAAGRGRLGARRAGQAAGRSAGGQDEAGRSAGRSGAWRDRAGRGGAGRGEARRGGAGRGRGERPHASDQLRLAALLRCERAPEPQAPSKARPPAAPNPPPLWGGVGRGGAGHPVRAVLPSPVKPECQCVLFWRKAGA